MNTTTGKPAKDEDTSPCDRHKDAITSLYNDAERRYWELHKALVDNAYTNRRDQLADMVLLGEKARYLKALQEARNIVGPAHGKTL